MNGVGGRMLALWATRRGRQSGQRDVFTIIIIIIAAAVPPRPAESACPLGGGAAFGEEDGVPAGEVAVGRGTGQSGCDGNRSQRAAEKEHRHSLGVQAKVEAPERDRPSQSLPHPRTIVRSPASHKQVTARTVNVCHDITWPRQPRGGPRPAPHGGPAAMRVQEKRVYFQGCTCVSSVILISKE